MIHLIKNKELAEYIGADERHVSVWKIRWTIPPAYIRKVVEYLQEHRAMITKGLRKVNKNVL